MKIGISILGCGWLGLPLGKFLAASQYNTKGSTRSVDKLPRIQEAGMKPYQILLPDLDGEHDFFHSDVLIITLPPSVPEYVKIIDNLIAKIVTSPVKHVLFISSTSVYPNVNGVVEEKDAMSITSTHSGVNLFDVEQLFRNNKNFETTILRFAGLYGPNRDPGRFLAGKKDLKGAAIPINLVHLDDCIGVIHQIIEQTAWGQTFNVCAPIHPEKKAFYTKACRKLGLEAPQFTADLAPYKVVNSDKLVQKLNYSFKHSDPMEDV